MTQHDQQAQQQVDDSDNSDDDVELTMSRPDDVASIREVVVYCDNADTAELHD